MANLGLGKISSWEHFPTAGQNCVMCYLLLIGTFQHLYPLSLYQQLSTIIELCMDFAERRLPPHSPCLLRLYDDHEPGRALRYAHIDRMLGIVAVQQYIQRRAASLLAVEALIAVSKIGF